MRKTNSRLGCVATVIILSVSSICALSCYSKNDTEPRLKYATYSSAPILESSPEALDEAIENNVGNAYIYGELSAVDPVAHLSLSGAYIAVTEASEICTSYRLGGTNGRLVAGGGMRYSWEVYESCEIPCTEVSFLEHKYMYTGIPDLTARELLVIPTGDNLRTVYYGIPATVTGTFYADFSDGAMRFPIFFEDATPEEAQAILLSNELKSNTFAVIVALTVSALLFLWGGVCISCGKEY